MPSGHILEAGSLQQARQIVDMVSQAVAAAGRPLGIAMPAKVGRHDMKVGCNARLRNHAVAMSQAIKAIASDIDPAD